MTFDEFADHYAWYPAGNATVLAIPGWPRVEIIEERSDQFVAKVENRLIPQLGPAFPTRLDALLEAHKEAALVQKRWREESLRQSGTPKC